MNFDKYIKCRVYCEACIAECYLYAEIYEKKRFFHTFFFQNTLFLHLGLGRMFLHFRDCEARISLSDLEVLNGEERDDRFDGDPLIGKHLGECLESDV